jgi:DNA-binding LacI/PurR family transcriptional regulator
MVGLEEVAKLAQVSRATASRALSRPDMVAEETRQRVVEAAQQLGYQTNQAASSLRRGQSQTIGAIISDILNPGQTQLAKGIQDAATKRDYTVFLFNSDEDPDKERRALESLRGHLPQGLILVPTIGAKDHLKLVGNLPVIELDRTSGLKGANTVMVDNIAGARAATQHLLALGHQRIAMIAGTFDVSTAVERHQGYREALEDAGFSYQSDLVRYANHREDGGRIAAHSLLALPLQHRPTALFVGNNEMTIGALLATRELGLSIPHDLSLVGFDDTRWAKLLQPAITVVSQPAYELAYLACETLFTVLGRENNTAVTNIRLPTQLIVRESTARPPA